MGRNTEQAGDSRQRIVESAIALMRGSGLSGAGINEIVRASSAPKGSVYHYFPAGKLQIASEALALYAERVRAFIDEALASRDAPAEKVKALFAAFARRVEEADFLASCAVGAVTLDLDADLEPLRAVLAATLSDWVDAIAAHFDLGDARRTRSFASVVITAIEGAYIRARAERSRQPFREAGDWLADLVER
jgi:AcrR family transcriptional regulator